MMSGLPNTRINFKSQEFKSLHQLLETRNKDVVKQWCLDYAEAVILPIVQKHKPEDKRFQQALFAAQAWLSGKMRPHDARIIINECRKAARDSGDNYIVHAAAMAIWGSAAAVQSTSNSMGFVYYGVAAVVFDTAGLDGSVESYKPIAAVECKRMESSLRTAAVDSGQNPAKFSWAFYRKLDRGIVAFWKYLPLILLVPTITISGWVFGLLAATYVAFYFTTGLTLLILIDKIEDIKKRQIIKISYFFAFCLISGFLAFQNLMQNEAWYPTMPATSANFLASTWIIVWSVLSVFFGYLIEYFAVKKDHEAQFEIEGVVDAQQEEYHTGQCKSR